MDPTWLAVLLLDLSRSTSPAPRRQWPRAWESDPSFFNVRWGQFSRVVRDAWRLLPIVPADEEFMPAEVWLQDRLQPQCDDDDHAVRPADSDLSHMADESCPPANVPVVAEAMGAHPGTAGKVPNERIEARQLWEAEKPSRLGAGLLCSDSSCRAGVPLPVGGIQRDPRGRAAQAAFQPGDGGTLLLRSQPAGSTPTFGAGAKCPQSAERRAARLTGWASAVPPAGAQERRGNALLPTAIPR